MALVLFGLSTSLAATCSPPAAPVGQPFGEAAYRHSRAVATALGVSSGAKLVTGLGEYCVTAGGIFIDPVHQDPDGVTPAIRCLTFTGMTSSRVILTLVYIGLKKYFKEIREEENWYTKRSLKKFR